jgi:hypothetical protein
MAEQAREQLAVLLGKRDAAAEKVAEARAQVKAWDMQNRAPPPRKKDEEFPNMPVFEVPAALREYHGDIEDRKAHMTHRKELQVGGVINIGVRLILVGRPWFMVKLGTSCHRCRWGTSCSEFGEVSGIVGTCWKCCESCCTSPCAQYFATFGGMWRERQTEGEGGKGGRQDSQRERERGGGGGETVFI